MDRIDYFVDTMNSLSINYNTNVGELHNGSFSTYLAIRPETVQKIKTLLRKDLYETCTENDSGIYQEYLISERWNKNE